MYKEDLALNNLQESICHKTHPNQKVPIKIMRLFMYTADKFVTLRFIFTKFHIFIFQHSSPSSSHTLSHNLGASRFLYWSSY